MNNNNNENKINKQQQQNNQAFFAGHNSCLNEFEPKQLALLCKSVFLNAAYN